MKYLIERLAEASTWRGITMVATAFGITVAPELLPAIVSAGTGVAGLIGILFKDKLK